MASTAEVKNDNLKVIDETCVQDYFGTLGSMHKQIKVTDKSGAQVALHDGLEQMKQMALSAHAAGRKVIFLGNGGSQAIASHMASDYTKNGGVRSTTFCDPSALTCLSNDLGYENVYAKPVSMFAQPGDLVVAISSSGKSVNILNAVEKAYEVGCEVVTLSGFGDSNPLREMGAVNFYVPSKEYGYVEITHLVLCHAVLDYICGL